MLDICLKIVYIKNRIRRRILGRENPLLNCVVVKVHKRL